MVAPRNEIGDLVKEKFVMLFYRLVLSARSSGGKFGKIVKEKFVMLLDRFVLSAQDVDGDREDDNKAKLGPKIAWPHVMNSSLAMRGPVASGTWIWHHQHAHWHHRYYRTRR
jgi:hypothetical protein